MRGIHSRSRLGFFLVILIIVGANPVAAVEPAAGSAAVSDFPGDLWRDAQALPTTENLWWLLGGTALTLVVHEIEDPDGAADALNQGVWDSLSDFGNIWSDIRLQAPLALGAWGIGSWTDHPEIADLGYDVSRGLLLTYGAVSALKVGFNRTRPNGEDYSFPSGHTAAAFTTAGVVSRHYGGWASAATIGLGVLAAMGRMEDQKHYASDVVAGATIGWIIGRTTGRSPETDGVSWQLVPMGQGLAIAGRF